jgi:hypothetical protein
LWESSFKKTRRRSHTPRWIQNTFSFQWLCLLVISFICKEVVYKNCSQVTYSMLNSQHLFISLILSSHNIFYLSESGLQKLFTGHIPHIEFTTLISLILSAHNIFYLWECSSQKLLKVTYSMLNSQHLFISLTVLLIISFICEKLVYKNSSQVT